MPLYVINAQRLHQSLEELGHLGESSTGMNRVNLIVIPPSYEWMIGLDVEESGVYGIKLDDDCNVVECVKMDEVKERVEKYGGGYENFEFWVGNDYEYWNIGVEK